MDIKSQIESLLFISAKPVAVVELAKIIKASPEEIKKAGDELVELYKSEKRGLEIIKDGSKFQMVSSPDNSKVIQEFIKDEVSGELSRPSLEALTIIAYREPISKLDLDRIRGVNCSLILRNLLIRGLIEARFDKKKGDTYYNVTFDFVRFLGINEIAELPDFKRLHTHDSLNRMINIET